MLHALTMYRIVGHSLQIRFIGVEYSDQGDASSVNEIGSLKDKPSIHTTECANTWPVPRILNLKLKILFAISKVKMAVDGEIAKNGPAMKNRAGHHVESQEPNAA